MIGFSHIQKMGWRLHSQKSYSYQSTKFIQEEWMNDFQWNISECEEDQIGVGLGRKSVSKT